MSISELVTAISTASVTELLRVVWMEIAMASFAAIVYCTLTGHLAPADKKLKSGKGAGGQMGRAIVQDPTSYQRVAKALRQGDVTEAIALMKELPETIAGTVPCNLAPRLLMAVAKSVEFDDMMTQMNAFVGKIESRSLDAVLMEVAKNKDVATGRQLQVMARTMAIPETPETLVAFAKALASDSACLRTLVEEAEAPLARLFAKALLEACTALKDVDLSLDIFDKVAEGDASFLRGVVEKASVAGDSTPNSKETRDVAMYSKQMRECGKNGDLEGAMSVFEQQRRNFKNTCLYNAIIDVCVECGNNGMATEYFTQARNSGLADVVSYNIAMKGYLAQGQIAAAKGLLAEISEKGLTPTLASFHGFLNYYVNHRDRYGPWKVVEEMQASGVLPTAVTCSILLKAKLESASDIVNVLRVVDTIDPMDEVLFHSIAEACIRTGQLQLLSKYQEKLSSQVGSCTLTAPTYGSMIKAFGKAKDVKKVWHLWDEMIKRDVKPTEITLGCMVESLVANWCTGEACKLVQQMRNEESTRALVNTVIYSTIIKGFSHTKETGKMMALYEEMKAHGVQPNNITYNTILNAFAQGGCMDRVPALLEDMKAAVPPAEPDIVTYSTIVKGFCNSGNTDKAMSVLKDMRLEGKFTPDEVMYNSLLDGCAKEHRPNDALMLLEEMKKNGVAPSNYTLSMLVKLMGRCRRVNQAFTIIEDISREYGLKVNIQVYTCLIQACFNNRQASKAVAIQKQIIKEGLCPDEMTYSVLVQGCLKAGLVDKAVELTKCAHGFATPKARGTAPGINARTLGELVSALGGEKSAGAQAVLADAADCKMGGGRRQVAGSAKVSAAAPPWRK